MPSIALTGRLDPYFETGTEGVVWAVVVDGLMGYDALFPLKDGDGLLIYGPNGTIAWEGTVDLEYERRYRPFPLNPMHGQQEIMGRWVHGLQRNCDPELWAQAFFDKAPAVIRPQLDQHLAGIKDKAALLDLLVTNPIKAWQEAQALSIFRHGLDWPMECLCRQMGWADLPSLQTDEEQAQAWHLYLALQRADRAAWGGKQPLKDRLGHRWPTLASFTPEDIQHWAHARLPHDSFYG